MTQVFSVFNYMVLTIVLAERFKSSSNIDKSTKWSVIISTIIGKKLRSFLQMQSIFVLCRSKIKGKTENPNILSNSCRIKTRFEIRPELEHNSNMTNDTEYLHLQDQMTKCHTLKDIGIYLSIMFILCFLSNFVLMWVFFKYTELQRPVHIFLLILIMFNMLGTLVEFPITIANAFSCKYVRPMNYTCFF
jgi:hypothetical protein